MKPQTQKLTQQIIRFSELLLELAEQEEWKRFEALLEKRDKLLRPFIAQDYSAEEAAGVRKAVQQIQHLDHQIRKLVENQKDQTLMAIRTDAKKQKAANAYQRAMRKY